MSDYVISCCSTADLTKEHFEKRNISYICFHYELNGKEYADDLGESMPFDQFYKAMQDGASTKTSQVNADEFEEYFEGFLKQGKDVLHVCLSSGISGVINSANVAKRIWRKSIRGEDPGGGFSREHPPDMGFLWINLQTFGMRANPLGGSCLGGGTQAEPASLVFFHRSYVLYQRRPYFQGQRLFRHDAEYLPAAEYG